MREFSSREELLNAKFDALSVEVGRDLFQQLRSFVAAAEHVGESEAVRNLNHISVYYGTPKGPSAALPWLRNMLEAFEARYGAGAKVSPLGARRKKRR